jgi:hypothetical protein
MTVYPHIVAASKRRPEHVSKRNGPVTFSLGIAVGGIGGFLLGAILGKQFVHIVSMIASLIDRRSSDEDRVRFELMSQ